MRDNSECEICFNNDLQHLGQRTFCREDSEKVSDYVKKRYKVLFDKWFPGKNKVELKIVLCMECGFIFYLPRPEEFDIDNKYRYLQELVQDSNQIPADSSTENKRSKLIYQYLSHKADLEKVKNILDFGGNDGRLMSSFLEAGKTCFLVDYNRNSIPGVTRLGDTIHALSPEQTFDLIVCSHVIEHVADPLGVIKELVAHLSKDGYLFIEVPMDILWELPLQNEPVTHINFFTPNSMENLLVQCGVQVIDCRLMGCFHPTGNTRYGIRCIGSGVDKDINNSKPGMKKVDAQDYLQPNVVSKIRHIMINPEILKRSSLQKLLLFFGFRPGTPNSKGSKVE